MDHNHYKVSPDHDDSEQENQWNEKDLRNLVRTEIKRNYRPKRPWGRFLVIALIGGIIGSAITGTFIHNIRPRVAEPEQKNIVIESQDDTVENAVYKKALPSIIGITTIKEEMGDIFNPGITYSEGVGSGVIISEDGYILTNSHVVRDGNAKSINVLFSDGEDAPAKLMFFDQTLDLAVIKVDKTNLVAAELGDSDTVEIGDRAIAIGNPLGLDLYATETSGIISGMKRSITLKNGQSMEGLLQTDAAINGGNSGGPLFNNKGQVIAINTAKASADNIGFAIPINIAKPIVESIIETGEYEPIQIGIRGIDVDIYARLMGQKAPVEAGVVVSDIVPGSPADKGKLQANDIIIEADGEELKGMSDLKQKVIVKKPGEQMEITVFRNGKNINLTIEF
ncbi:MAG: trypsin-like peptidase domain-containing protein [Tissierellia bacterium]|nr:trypsin-like peptidase domain-containing protein [Tissierellia bacterium]